VKYKILFIGWPGNVIAVPAFWTGTRALVLQKLKNSVLLVNAWQKSYTSKIYLLRAKKKKYINMCVHLI